MSPGIESDIVALITPLPQLQLPAALHQLNYSPAYNTQSEQLVYIDSIIICLHAVAGYVAPRFKCNFIISSV